MMKHIFAFLLLFMPAMCFARDDHCTKPDEYTIDKRCYVTDEQKQQNPYKSVVSLDNCSGTIIKSGNEFYLYTARHCLNNNNKISGRAELTNGITLKPGDLVAVGSNDKDDDWAIFAINPKDVYKVSDNYTQFSDKDFEQNATSVGYGSLTILSDEQLSYIKKEYVRFLQMKYRIPTEQINLQTNANATGIIYDGMYFNSDLVREFFAINDNIKIFEDNNMKKSNCAFSNNRIDGYTCQTWHHDSGGGVFDANGKIMGIISHGYGLIGGPHHASGDYSITQKPDFIFPIKDLKK